MTRGGRLTVAECSVRMIYLRERTRGAKAETRRRLRRRYQRLGLRCVAECSRERLRKLERKALGAGSAAKERKRRVKHRRVVDRCHARARAG